MYLSGEISGQREIMSQFLISWFLGWKENIMFCHTRYLPNLISCCWSSCWGEQYLLDCCSKLHPDLTPEVSVQLQVIYGGWRVYHFILMLLLKINTYLLRTWSPPWLNGEINDVLPCVQGGTKTPFRKYNIQSQVSANLTPRYPRSAKVFLKFLLSSVTSCTFNGWCLNKITFQFCCWNSHINSHIYIFCAAWF